MIHKIKRLFCDITKYIINYNKRYINDKHKVIKHKEKTIVINIKLMLLL